MLPKLDARIACLIVLYLGWAASGVAQVLTTNIGAHYVIMIIIAAAAATWTMLDAKAREQPLLPIVLFIVLLLWAIALPIYLIYSRGWRGVMWTIVNTAGLIATLFIAYNGAIAVMYAVGAYG